MPLDKPAVGPDALPEERPSVSSFKEISERLEATGNQPLTFEQGGVILPFLERLYDAENLLREAKIHLNPASPLSNRVAGYFARLES